MPCPLCAKPLDRHGECRTPGCQPTGMDFLEAARGVAKRVLAEAQS